MDNSVKPIVRFTATVSNNSPINVSFYLYEPFEFKCEIFSPWSLSEVSAQANFMMFYYNEIQPYNVTSFAVGCWFIENDQGYVDVTPPRLATPTQDDIWDWERVKYEDCKDYGTTEFYLRGRNVIYFISHFIHS